MNPATGRPTVALLTEPGLPGLGPDDAPLIDAFVQAGWQPIPRQWRAPAAGDSLALIRSCWDYTAHPEAFLEALTAWGAVTPLWNPIETVAWNSSKRYLLELGSQGQHLPRTVVVEADDPTPLDQVMTVVGANDVVVKPVVGASGIGAWRTGVSHDARWQQRTEPMLVQEFMPEIEQAGELSLIWFRDGYSHAVVKRPRAGEFRVQEEHGGRTEPIQPSAELLRQVERILAGVVHPWAYARVDGVMSAGRFVLMELELVEPELFFRFAPTAAARFVATLTAGLA